MILLADSGSTKTEWVVLEDFKISKRCFSMGINPYFNDTKGVIDIFENEVLAMMGKEVPTEIYFYGSGCSTPTKKATIENALRYFYPDSKIEIEHDLIASARALFHHRKGIACILGTGSNSCLYDGTSILENVTSLGYFFGDEGSGGYIGKLLLLKYLRKELSNETLQLFDRQYQLSVENILDAIYNKPKPNRFLASFSPFVLQNMHNPEIEAIARQNFNDFFNTQVCKYTDFQHQEVSFIGSVAHHYSTIIREVASEFEIKVGTILQSPTEGLIKYHCDKKF